jgi:putative transposase
VQHSGGLQSLHVNWDLWESMAWSAKELHPEARSRIISDNGPQFIAKDCKEFIRSPA